MTTQTGPEADAPRLYAKAVTNARERIAAVRPDQWEDATPCTEWNVRQLVSHMVSTTRNVKSILEGNGPQNWGDNVLGDDPLAAFDEARAGALAAVNAAGAMGRTVTTRQGERPAADYAIGQLQEMLVHGWDLAKATGQDTAMDPELVEVGYARALRNRDRLRSGTAWGESEANVADGADLQTKYLGILGRMA